jgi:tRNA/rRNA methyltransferase
VSAAEEAAPEPCREGEGTAAGFAVVLVEPREPGNVGAVARAMHNMGLRRMILIRPCNHLDREAYRMALDGASILEKALLNRDLREALADFGFVVGTTRRPRGVRRQTLSPRSAAAELAEKSDGNRCAVLFGREDRGLTNDEIEVCHRIVTVPSAPGAESLNLSQAVLVMAYEAYLAVLDREKRRVTPGPRKLASTKELEGLYGHMQDALLSVGYLDEKNPKRMMRVFREIFARSGLDGREVRALRGIFRQVNWFAGREGSGGHGGGRGKEAAYVE